MLEAETSGHLFWSCPRAKRAWSCFGLLNPNYAVQFNNFMELAWKMIMVDHCDDSAVALVGMIAWRMWVTEMKFVMVVRGLVNWICVMMLHSGCCNFRKQMKPLLLRYLCSPNQCFNILGYLPQISYIK